MARARARMKVEWTHRRWEALGNITVRTNKEAEQVVKEIRDGARALAPVRTGNLKRSIKAHRYQYGWVVEVGAPYGIYVEYGTRNMRAQPYLTPAFERAKRNLRQRLRKGIL